MRHHVGVPEETRRAPDDVLVHLRRARDLADLEFAEPLDLDGLAAVAGLSKFHFLRLFRATYGVTPGEYLSQRRIERAQDLLRATNLTVTEVCHAVGFSSLGSFSSRFRAVVGESPSEFQAPLRRPRSAPHPRLLRLHVGPRRAGRPRARVRNRGEARTRTAVLALSPMITNISIVSVFVKDIDESKKFYTDVLGFAGEGRHHPRRRLPLVHRRPPEPARAPGQPRHPRAAALRRRWSRR